MANNALDQLDPTHPYRVPSHIGKVRLVVVGNKDKLPMALKGVVANAPGKLSLRIVGGCSGMEASDREMMLEWFVRNLVGFRGLVSSGATREVDSSGRLDPMVTEVPAALAAQGGDAITTVSTLPRTGDFVLVDDSRLQIEGSYGPSHPNPAVHTILAVQDQIGGDLMWDGDLETYFKMLQERRNCAIVWNGGGVTKTEIKMALRYGWDVILVQGSGRAADEYIGLARDGKLDLRLEGETASLDYDASRHKLHIVDKQDPESLRCKLRDIGFL